MKPARIVVADPPWFFRNRHLVRQDGQKPRYGGGAAGMYSAGCMEYKDIAALPVGSICADDAYLFLWSTLNHVMEAFNVAAAWGFAFTGSRMTWVKTYHELNDEAINELMTEAELNREVFFGRGRYIPSCTEDLWLFRRGDLWHTNTGWKPKQVIHAPIPRHPKDWPDAEKAGKPIHSRKPYAFQDAIDDWLDPYIREFSKVELFATQRRADWICLGHELSGGLLQDELPELATHLRMAQELGVMFS